MLLSELDNPQALAAAWMALALLASLISIRLGISVALTEILFGVLAGNAFHLQANEWINFLAGFGSIVLTFLAGAEIEPAVLRRNLSQTMAISFANPMLTDRKVFSRSFTNSAASGDSTGTSASNTGA